MALTWPAIKDPNEVKEYQLVWANELVGDTIATSTWTIAEGSGLTINSNNFTDKATEVWLSAGVAGTTYLLLNRITTTGGRTFDQSVKLKVRNK